jgi:hypothetical protein
MSRLLIVCLLVAGVARADLTAPAAQSSPATSCAENLRQAAQTLIDTNVPFAERGVLRLTDDGGVEYTLSLHGRCESHTFSASFLPARHKPEPRGSTDIRQLLRTQHGFTASLYIDVFYKIPTFVPLFRAALERCLSAAKQPPASAPRVNRT